MSEENRWWRELHQLVDRLPVEQVATPGYFQEGWSAKDLLAHLASWLSEAGVVLEQMRFGTYRVEEIDIDAMNQRFYETMKDVPLSTIGAQGLAARNRMLKAWGALGDRSPEADAWIRKAGAEHYAEHLPRLREWVDELTSGNGG